MRIMKKIFLLCSLVFSISLVGCNSAKQDEPFVSPTISLSERKVSLSIGKTYTLVATTSETSMLIYWFTRDTSIATVDNKGEVTALSVGTTVCYAQVGTNTAMCSITVTPYEPNSSLFTTCSSTNVTLSVNDEYKLPIEVRYGKAIINEYQTRADIIDNTICSFEDGKVTGLKLGETTLLLTIIYLENFDQISFTVLVA